MFTVASLSTAIGGLNSTTTSLSDACHPEIVSDEPTFDTERSTASSRSSENGFAIGLNRSVTSASIDRCLKSGVMSAVKLFPFSARCDRKQPNNDPSVSKPFHKMSHCFQFHPRTQ